MIWFYNPNKIFFQLYDYIPSSCSYCMWHIIWLCVTHNLWQLMIHNQFIGRLKRAHFGRIHKRNARRKGGIGSLKSDNRAEKNRSDRKEKDRNKGERNHKVQSKYKKNHSKRRSLKVWTFWALIILLTCSLWVWHGFNSRYYFDEAVFEGCRLKYMHTRIR